MQNTAVSCLRQPCHAYELPGKISRYLFYFLNRSLLGELAEVYLFQRGQQREAQHIHRDGFSNGHLKGG